MKYNIILEVDGIENFTTVMTVVEGCKGIRVKSAGMSEQVEEKPRLSSHRVLRKTRSLHPSGKKMVDLFIEHVEKTIPEGMSETTIRSAFMKNWMKREGFAPQSWGSLAHDLRQQGRLVNLDVIGNYKFIRK